MEAFWHWRQQEGNAGYLRPQLHKHNHTRQSTDPVYPAAVRQASVQGQEETRDLERGQWMPCVSGPVKASCDTLETKVFAPPERNGDSSASEKSTAGHTHVHTCTPSYMHNSCTHMYSYTESIGIRVSVHVHTCAYPSTYIRIHTHM